MKKEFVTYEEADKLKELKFDEACLKIYVDRELENVGDENESGETRNSSYDDSRFVVAPLYQQAFRWFRDKHNLSHDIQKTRGNKYWAFSNGLLCEDEKDQPILYETYEEAELACLKKLIEIVKSR